MSDNNSNEISDLTDQKYLDICEEFKGVIEKKDKDLNKMKNDYMRIYKGLALAYGSFRMIDDWFENLELDDMLTELDWIRKTIEVSRSQLSEIIEVNVIGDED
tara:strand:- start:576 stop:884 length:309 start_codon:yes stop_codon:yes gene_type:complete